MNNFYISFALYCLNKCKFKSPVNQALLFERREKVRLLLGCK